MNKNRIIFIIIFSIFFILSISTYYNTLKQKEYIDIKHQQSFDILQQMIDGKIIFFRKQFASRIKNFIHSHPELGKAITLNDQEKIKNIMNKMFALLKRENKYTKTLHLISNNNISVYRAHKPDKKGDDVGLFRPIIKYVNKHKRAKYGFEAGLYAMVYRVDIPIVYGNKHYGVLEYGIDSNIFVDDLTSVSNYIESAILVKKDVYNKLKAKKLELQEKVINISKNHILLDNDTFFTNVNINKILKNEKFENKGEYYTAFLYDLLSFQGVSAGKIFIAVNMTADQYRYKEMIRLSITHQIILIFIMFIIVFYAFNYYEQKIKELIEQENKNERLLQQQSKMASMGEMIGNIAHQWRQPLSVISTVASSIQVQKEIGTFKEDDIINSMEKIVQQTNHLSNTIDDFRNFFKKDKQTIFFNLLDIIDKDISLIEASFKNHNIKVVTQLTKDININGYPNELTQAILNILNNSKDQLIKDNQLHTKIVKIETKLQNDSAHIIISDNGGGIPEDIIHKILEPYFTTKHKSQGTGIGLYMTNEIIVKHFKGQIIISNEEFIYDDITYIGAVFKIILPINSSDNI